MKPTIEPTIKPKKDSEAHASPIHSLIGQLLTQDPNQAVNWGKVGKILKARLKIPGMTSERIIHLYELYNRGGWWGMPRGIAHFLDDKFFNDMLVEEIKEQEEKCRKDKAIHAGPIPQAVKDLMHIKGVPTSP